VDTVPDAPGVEPRRVLTARTAVAVVFLLNGLAVGSWFARVPAARDVLGLTAGELGVLLLALSAGALLALFTAGVVAHRLGAVGAVATGTLLLAAGLTLAGSAIGWWASAPGTAVALFAIGYGAGTCEVAMNIEAATVERLMGRAVMPRFHAAWSIGTVLGAVAGAAAARIGLPVAIHLGLVAAVVLAGTLAAIRLFLSPAGRWRPADPGPSDPGPGGGGRTKPAGAARGSGVLAAWREPRTLLVGLLVLVVAFTEGTANDWVAVAFIDGYRVSEATGAVAFGVFVAAMTVGRTVGAPALDRWGRVPVLLVTMLLAIVGTVIAVFAGSLPLAIVGVAVWGLGASLGFPVGMSAAGDDAEHAAARVSVVAVIGYTAFLAGPPLVGFLGDRVGTLRALLVVPIVLLPALALTPATRRPGRRP
jgi:predicted MFS family arabinose efflux permease